MSIKCLCCGDEEIQFSALCQLCKDNVNDYAMIKHDGAMIVLYRIRDNLFLKSTIATKEDRQILIKGNMFKLRTYEVLRIANLIWDGEAGEELSLYMSAKIRKANYSTIDSWEDEEK